LAGFVRAISLDSRVDHRFHRRESKVLRGFPIRETIDEQLVKGPPKDGDFSK
jgi:hypothetical protein